MKSRIRTFVLVIIAIAVIAFVANGRDLFDNKKHAENMLLGEGLTPVAVSIHNVNSTFTATVNSDPSCTVSGMTDATDDAWMLAGFNSDWYPRNEYNYSDPGLPKWPPHGVTVAQVALEHPQICNIT